MSCLSSMFLRSSLPQLLLHGKVCRTLGLLSPVATSTGKLRHVNTAITTLGVSPDSSSSKMELSQEKLKRESSDTIKENRGRQQECFTETKLSRGVAKGGRAVKGRGRRHVNGDETQLSTKVTKSDVSMATTEPMAGSETGSKVKGGKRSVMREQVGEGKVLVTPVEVLPISEGSKPLLYHTGNRSMDYDTLKKRSSSRSCALTNDNFIADEFEFAALDTTVKEVSSMATDHVLPEVREVVDYLVTEVGLSKANASKYLNSPPSLLGVTLNDMKKRVEILKGLGFGKKKQVTNILSCLSFCMDVDWSNFKDVYLLLAKEVGIKEHLITGLMKRHPFIFVLDSDKIRRSVLKLKDLNLSSTEIANLLDQAPILASVPLKGEAMDVLQEFKLEGLGTHAISPLILQNILGNSSCRVKLCRDTALLTTILHSYSADPQCVLHKCPHFFQQNVENLQDVLKILSGKPLYLDPQDIAKLLETVPHILCSITDMKKLRKHLKYLTTLFDSPSVARSKLRAMTGLVDPGCGVRLKYRALTSRSFSREQALSLLTKFPQLLTQDLQHEFVPRLELLLRIPEVDPSNLTQSPDILTVPVKVVKARHSFASRHKPDLLEPSRLEDLFCSSNEDFVAMCGSAVEVYCRETGVDGKVRKRGRPRKKKIIKKSEDLSQSIETLSTNSGPIADKVPQPLQPPSLPAQPSVDTPLSQQPLLPSPDLGRSHIFAKKILDSSLSEDDDDDVECINADSLINDHNELPVEIEKVLDSNILLSSSNISPDISVYSMKDPLVGESFEESDNDGESDSESTSLDSDIAKDLEELMSKLSESSSKEYRLSSSNRLIIDAEEELVFWGDLMDYDLPVGQPGFNSNN